MPIVLLRRYLHVVVCRSGVGACHDVLNFTHRQFNRSTHVASFLCDSLEKLLGWSYALERPLRPIYIVLALFCRLFRISAVSLAVGCNHDSPEQWTPTTRRHPQSLAAKIIALPPRRT